MRTGAPLLLLVAVGGCAAAGIAPAVPSDCPLPRERPALSRVTDVAPGIREDIRYATADNFTGAPLPGYEAGVALLRPEAAAALARVQRRLEERGLGLLVWDAYRPVRATEAMVAWAEETGNEWVLERGYVARRSNHNRGNTVDLTLIRLGGGEPLDMGTAYDHFGVEAHTANASGEVRANRRILVEAMEADGWRNYDQEWWHYTHVTEAGFLDVPIACYRPAVGSGPAG
jgi:D-alanyl-D-alanine dipeptidase